MAEKKKAKKKKQVSQKVPAKMGRPCKLTLELQNQIVDAIKAGAYVETAAAYAGVSKVTLYDWMKRRRRDEGKKFVDFLNAVEKALAASEIRDVMTITKAADLHWQAAAWRLERKNPSRWGRRNHVELTGSDGGPVSLEVKTWADLVTKAASSSDEVDGDDEP